MDVIVRGTVALKEPTTNALLEFEHENLYLGTLDKPGGWDLSLAIIKFEGGI